MWGAIHTCRLLDGGGASFLDPVFVHLLSMLGGFALLTRSGGLAGDGRGWEEKGNEHKDTNQTEQAGLHSIALCMRCSGGRLGPKT